MPLFWFDVMMTVFVNGDDGRIGNVTSFVTGVDLFGRVFDVGDNFKTLR